MKYYNILDFNERKVANCLIMQECIDWIAGRPGFLLEDIQHIDTPNYLGLSGVVSHSKINTTKYNKLLSLLGSEGITMQFERFLDDEMLTDFISHVEDNLFENDIKIPY